jgi:carbamoyl-phosphate synthase large subunit
MNTKKRLNVLVSAVGGDVGQAIIKSLKIAGRDITLHGCDIENNEIGSLFVDTFHIVPPATEYGYLVAINALAIDLDADVFIPASEQEIVALATAGYTHTLPGGTLVICQDSRIISTYGDKLRCMDALDQHIRLARYADGNNHEAIQSLVDDVGFPLVIKECFSRGSKSIKIANTYDELATVLKFYKSPIIQEYIDDTFGEFSVGIFSDGKKIESIAFKRNLGLTGASWYAETSSDMDVIEYSEKIAQIVAPVGSINIQVRKSIKGVRLLEINPRFSSLAAARAIAGFNDALWSLDLELKGAHHSNQQGFRKIRFRRYISEVIDFGKGFEAILEWIPIKQ